MCIELEICIYNLYTTYAKCKDEKMSHHFKIFIIFSMFQIQAPLL